jgi:hypothetical protein
LERTKLDLLLLLSSDSLAQGHLTKRRKKTNKQMPYQVQQTPKILDTGMVKMQASVATALLLFSFVSPTIKTSIPLQVSKDSPFLFLFLFFLSSYLSWSIHQTKRSRQTAAPCSTAESVKRKLKRGGGVGHSPKKKHRITQTEKNRQTASFQVRTETK